MLKHLPKDALKKWKEHYFIAEKLYNIAVQRLIEEFMMGLALLLQV